MSFGRRLRSALLSVLLLGGVLLVFACRSAGLELSRINELPQAWRGVLRGWTGGEETSKGNFVLNHDNDGNTTAWSKGPISYKIASELSEEDASRVKAAFEKTGIAAGHVFIYKGRTEAQPGRDGIKSSQREITVSLEDAPSESQTPDAVAVGFAEYMGHERIRGAVVLYRSRVEHGSRLERVVMHELGHVLGLDHSADPTQVMYESTSQSYPAEWGRGDIDGFRALQGS